MKGNLALLLLLLVTCSFKPAVNAPAVVKIYSEEMKLYNMIMEYRKIHNLAIIPLSKSLTFVAQEHCKDLSANHNNNSLAGTCNMHSWSQSSKWSSCCYTPDHRFAQCMWDKPKELTSYGDTGYEISFGTSSLANADMALNSWIGSSTHNQVILNEGIWKNANWNAIGIGIKNGYATVWFGLSVDKEGAPVAE
ncbi:MAG TPA: hypothetical protein VF623_10175 [Segetibacter sp.]|jgi:hypothetical protein